MNELDKIREVFLADVDAETYQENKAQIESWEAEWRDSELRASWSQHEFTIELGRQVRDAYRDLCTELLSSVVDDAKRQELFAKKNAIQWIISLIDGNDGKKTMEELTRMFVDIYSKSQRVV